MNRIDSLFNVKSKRVLSVYFTAGYPVLHSVERIILSLEKNGADMVEIGIPYSDPLADGKVIQNAGKVAIANGLTINNLFLQLRNIREKTSLPILLMSYLNPVIQFGFSEFCSAAAKSGVDGLIIPDLPLFEYKTTYSQITDQFGLRLVFLITPDTSEQRVREIDSLSTGFIYLVSSASTTGNTGPFDPEHLNYFRRTAAMGLKNPTMAGFGIHDHDTLEQVFSYCTGAIIGSAYLRSLSTGKSIEQATAEFFDKLKNTSFGK
jgi:tryptophan synthase alpha chain